MARQVGFFSFEDLEVYRLSLVLARDVYLISASFPKGEQFGLTNQVRRAATSITLNIAEGRGRGTDKDFARFLWHARGSLFEVVAAFSLSQTLGFTNENDHEPIRSQAKVLGSKLTALINTLNKSES